MIVRVYVPSPNLDKTCVWILDVAPSHEILRRIYFVVKKGLNRVVGILSALFLFFFVTNVLFC